jgi:NDP-sugar pyrophosphorylase family protein
VATELMPPVAVLAGGLGTRLYPDTKTMPKSLIEIAGRPFIAHQIELFARRGIRRAVYCLGYLGEQIQAFVGDGSRFGIAVEYLNDGDCLRGTGGAVLRALPSLGDEFFVTYGDSYLDIPYEPVAEAFRAVNLPALMTVYSNKGAWDTSNVEFVDGKIVAYSKTGLTPRMHHIDFGLLAMRPDAFDAWREEECFDLSAVLEGLVGAGRIAGFETMQRFYEIGSRTGIADLETYLARPA